MTVHTSHITQARKPLARAAAIWMFALCLLCLPFNAQAHDVPASTVLLDIGRTAVDAELQLPLSELGLALSQPLSSAPEQVIARSGAQISDYVLRHMRVSTAAGEAYTPTVQSLALRHTGNPNGLSRDWLDIRLRMRAPQGADTEVFTLDYDVIVAPLANHNAFVSVRRDFRNALFGDQPQMVGLIGFQQTQLKIDGSGGHWGQGFKRIFSMGVQHIAEGTDHLLFLLVLLLPAPLVARRSRWREADGMSASLWKITKSVSGFTLGHSLTLAIGALGLFTLPTQPVEILIAVSIIVSAIHALRPVFSGRELYLAAGFGLIHGLAFASALSGLNYDAWTLALSLIGFNLGIETMQLLVIAAVLPLLLMLSRTRAYSLVRMLAASFAVVCALGWIAERGWQLRKPLSSMPEQLLPHAIWGILLLAGAALFVGARRLMYPLRGREARAREALSIGACPSPGNSLRLTAPTEDNLSASAWVERDGTALRRRR